jgi:4-diphosphocytidyl-2C-methyl-D-erythritol kinase
MTPHEKAKELYDRYYKLAKSDIHVYTKDAYKKKHGHFAKSKADDHAFSREYHAKQAAQKAVDEILNNVLVVIDVTSLWNIYWQQVKTEIEKL